MGHREGGYGAGAVRTVEGVDEERDLLAEAHGPQLDLLQLRAGDAVLPELLAHGQGLVVDERGVVGGEPRVQPREALDEVLLDIGGGPRGAAVEHLHVEDTADLVLLQRQQK